MFCRRAVGDAFFVDVHIRQIDDGDGFRTNIAIVVGVEVMGIRVFDDEQIRVGFIHIVADVTVDAVADDEVFSEFVATEFVGEMFVVQLAFDVVEIWFEQLGG